MRATTPNKIDHKIISILELLDLDKNNAVFLRYTLERKFTAEINNCHINNLVKQSYDGGEIIYGWIIWENKDAIFFGSYVSFSMEK